jgi:uncharacterized DUF497 family protein
VPPPPRPFRLVYRAFDRIEFDPAKSDAVFDLRGFDLAYARRVFPGYVLEREDYGEPRFCAIGEVLQDVLAVIYTPRGGTCRLITAWEAEGWELDLWYE